MNTLKILTASLTLAAAVAPALAQVALPGGTMNIVSRTSLRIFSVAAVDLSLAVDPRSAPSGLLEMTPGNSPPFHYLEGPSNPTIYGRDYWLAGGILFDAASNGGTLGDNAGRFAFRYGWDVFSGTGGFDPNTGYAFPEFPGGTVTFDSTWIYEFTLIVDGIFRLNYNLSSDNIFFLSRPDTQLIGDGAVGGSGSFTYALTAGQNFKLSVKTVSGRAFGGENAQHINIFNVEDAFSYQLTPFNTAIPEPATWAMMIAGFGAVGAAVRRRAKVRVTYA